MKFELKPYHRDIPDKSLIADLKQTSKRLGSNTITAVQYDRHGRYCAHTIIRRFGTWNEALKKAQLQISNYYNIPIEQLFGNLQRIWTKVGRQPTFRDMCPPQSRYSLATYAHRFGTWRKALQAFIAAMSTHHPAQPEVNAKTPHSHPAPALRPHKTSRTPNWRLRFRVMQRDNFRCVACGQSPAKDPRIRLHIDHIVSWHHGGETTYENLQTLCHICNIGKSHLTADCSQVTSPDAEKLIKNEKAALNRLTTKRTIRKRKKTATVRRNRKEQPTP